MVLNKVKKEKKYLYAVKNYLNQIIRFHNFSCFINCIFYNFMPLLCLCSYQKVMIKVKKN